MKHLVGIALLSTLLLAPFGVFAELATSSVVEPETIPDVAAFPTPTVLPLVRIALAIVGVTMVGWGLTYWSRKRSLATGGANAKIDILATRGIGARHQVALLEVSGRRLLVGMGSEAITTLADLTDEMDFGAQLHQKIEPEETKEELVKMIGRFEGLDG